MRHTVAVIGLGVMGQRMLRNMFRYPGFEPVAAWDPDPEAAARTAELYPSLSICRSAEEAIGEHGCAATYIACPPAYHHDHALMAFEHGQAVFCEKPLGVDIEVSAALTERAESAGLVNIVNYTLASAPAAVELGRELRSGELGEVAGVDLRLHFSQWPEPWQVDAARWLDYPEQGGFVREVVSHWLFLTERLLGPAELLDAWVRYPPTRRSETHVHAALRCGEVPVSIAGSVGGHGPDLFEYTVWASARSARILDWGELWTSDDTGWTRQLRHLENPRERGYEQQLANAANAVAGVEHSMPSFRDALSVQKLIESIVNA